MIFDSFLRCSIRLNTTEFSTAYLNSELIESSWYFPRLLVNSRRSLFNSLSSYNPNSFESWLTGNSMHFHSYDLMTLMISHRDDNAQLLTLKILPKLLPQLSNTHLRYFLPTMSSTFGDHSSSNCRISFHHAEIISILTTVFLNCHTTFTTTS